MKKILALMILATGSMFAGTHFSFGVAIGGPRYYAPRPVYVAPPPPVYAAPAYNSYYEPAPAYVEAPPSPGYGYVWVHGYWNSGYARRVWVRGYWRAPHYGYSYGRRWR